MVYRNNAGKLGAGFISVCRCGLERRWLGHLCAFYVLVCYCKRRALAFYFSESVRICYMFLISKYRRESDLGLCMASWLAKRMWLRSRGNFWCKHKRVWLHSEFVARLFEQSWTPRVRWGFRLVFSEWTQILSGIQVTTHFINLFGAETKWSNGSVPPKNGVIALWPNMRVVKCKYYVSQKQNGFNTQWYNILLTFIF